MALDDTIERRRGARIAAKGICRDPVRSSHGHFVKASGLRWLCLKLIAPVPWAKRCRAPGTIGRPRRKGERQPTLKAVSTGKATRWRSVTLSQWYGQGDKAVEIATGSAIWYHKGLATVPLRWVLVRDPLRRLVPQAFLCTDRAAEPEQILSWFWCAVRYGVKGFTAGRATGTTW